MDNPKPLTFAGAGGEGLVYRVETLTPKIGSPGRFLAKVVCINPPSPPGVAFMEDVWVNVSLEAAQTLFVVGTEFNANIWPRE